MKKFINAEINEMEINKTAFGPLDPDSCDEVKEAVLDADGNIIGWKAKFGTTKSSTEA